MTGRLVSVVVALTTLIVIAFSVPLVLVVQSIARGDEERDTRVIATSLASAIDEQAGAVQVRSVLARFDAGDPGIRVAVFGRTGPALGSPEERGPSVEVAFGGVTVTRRLGGAVVVDAPSAGIDSVSAYVVRVVAPDDDVGPDLGSFYLGLALSGLAAIAVAGATTAIAARSIARPTRRLTEAARRLERGELDTRIPVGGPAETRDLARALDALAARVRGLLDAERESVADLAHRLRTPLTALHLEIEALPPGEESAQLLDRARRLERELDEVIAEMRRPEAPPAAERADVRAVAAERVADWRDVAAERGDTLDAAIEPEGRREVALGGADLEAVIDVLIDNAVTHTPPGTRIEFAVRDAAGGIEMVVDDDGPGLPPGPLAARGVSTEASSGLGLDIARRAAERAGGAFHLGASPAGGARVRLVLPVLSSDPGPSESASH